MIKNISIIIARITSSTFRPSYYFCQKTDILKTYLEIIPPHKIYQIKQKFDHKVENSLISLERLQSVEGKQRINEDDIKVLSKQIKKRTRFIQLPVLTRIAQVACKLQESEYKIELRKIYTKIIRTVKDNTQKLSLEEMVDLVYKLVKLNKKQYQLMKEVQKIIIEQKVKIDYPLIRKILFSYTHLNQGSSVLYSHISRTLTIGQHQFRPIQLAEAAYMLSKVSQNAKGGYGVFLLAQQHVEAVLPRLSFTELVKTSSYLLTQDLGSNKFQMKLQQALYNTYPAKDKIKITDFVVLLKSTSGYFFKFKENALLSMLKTTTLRMAKYATLQQFQDILWSWGRLGKGDRQLWQCLQNQLFRHLQVLKPRQIAFAYYSLCTSPHSTTDMLKAIENKFMEFPLQTLNEHYLIKFLLGMQKKKLYDNQIFIKVSEIVSKKIQKISNNQFLSFLKIMNQSDLDFQSKQKIIGVINSITTVANQLQTRLYTLKLTQIAELLFLLVKFQIDHPNLLNKCFKNLQNIINIPKSAFIKVMFSFIIKQQYQKCLQFVPILQQLVRYGPIGYFFSPFEFPLLAYCLFNLSVNGQNIIINEKLLAQTEDALKQINPSILNQFVRKGYKETQRLIQIYHTKQVKI